MKATKLLLASAAGLLLLAGCAAQATPSGSPSTSPSESSSPSVDPARPLVVGIVTKDQANVFTNFAIEQAKVKAAELGNVEIVAAAGKFDTDSASQVKAIENMIVKGVDAILVAPAESKALLPVIAKAQEAGIIVTAFDSPTDPQDATDGFYSWDAAAAGKQMGDFARAAWGTETPIKLAILGCEPSNAGCNRKIDAFEEALAMTSSDSVVAEVDSKATAPGGQTAMETVLQKDPATNLVFAINESAGFGAAKAISNAGKTADIKVVTFDGSCKGVREIQNGGFWANLQTSPGDMAQTALSDVVAALRGEGPVPSGFNQLTTTVISSATAEGQESVLPEAGLQTCWGE